MTRFVLGIAFLFLAGGFFSLPSFAYYFSPLEMEELRWRNTKLDITWVDDQITEKYCGADVRFFRGCFAMVETMARQIDPQLEISLAKNPQLTIIKNPALKEPVGDLQTKAFWQRERSRYAVIEKMDLNSATKNLVMIYQNLKKLKSNFAPYEIGRMFNSASAYTYDPNSMYLPGIKYDSAPVSPTGPVMGIGFDVSRVVNYVMRGSDAEKSGIQRGDVLVSIEGRNAAQMSAAQFDLSIQKKSGEKLKLGMSRHGSPLTFIVTFRNLQVQSFQWREATHGGKSWGYLAFEKFYDPYQGEGLCRQIEKKLKVANNSTSGLVIDLRDNGGGDTSIANCILGLFIGGNVQTVKVEGIVGDGDAEIFGTEKSSLTYTKPVVILQDIGTASSAEIFAGSMKIMGRGLIVGTRSYGKGSVQTHSEVGTLEHAETSFVYYLADGQSPQKRGITPDLEVYKFAQPASYETESLRIEDIGIHPIQADQATPFAKPGIKPMVVPATCIQNANALGQFQRMSDHNPRKDLQLITALAALNCR